MVDGTIKKLTDRPTRLGLFLLTPGRLLACLLSGEVILLLSEQFQWFPFNVHKGWTVLVAIACLGVATIFMLLWFLLALSLRWRFQFSIQTLLALTVVVAIPFSWLAVEIKRTREQRAAANAIERIGGETHWGEPFDLVVNNPGRTPEWLRKLLGDDFFVSVSSVVFENTPVTDEDMKHLEALSGLEDLWLNNTHITDAGLEHLKGLNRLNMLRLENTLVTDAGMEHLKGLKKLGTLWLDNTQITDAGLERLSGLSELRSLNLNGTKVTDAGMEHLKKLKLMRWLQFRHTKVTDECVEKLRQAFPNLQGISR